MSREIKFRQPICENGVFKWWHFWSVDQASPIEGFEWDERPNLQYTGLKDKNGVEIYEGDIVKWHDIILQITWSDHGRWMMGIDDMCIGDAEECEVIGNIYEDSELCAFIGTIYGNPDVLEAK